MKGARKGKGGSRKAHRLATPSAAIEMPSRSKEILRDLVKGVLFIVLVLGLKLIVERLEFGHQLHLMSYTLLQQKLSPEHVPVTIVDISELQPDQTGATPREPLRKLIEAITEHDPKAIGVDLDFSPIAERVPSHPNDEEYFNFCIDIMNQRGVPIFLGIRRTALGAPSEWLGSEQYQDLAANILIPKDTKKMWSEIRVEGLKPSKTMSAALAESFGPQLHSTGWISQLQANAKHWMERAGIIERRSIKRLGPNLLVEEFLVDFSPLASIKPLRTIDPGFIRNPNNRELFQGKAVLLGADEDLHVVGQQQYPGAFLHAGAAYTLIQAPLYEVTAMGNVIIDIVFLMAILLTLTLIRIRYRNRRSEEVATHRIQGLLTVVVVFVAVLIGVMFVQVTRVMWHDFFLALAAIIFHPTIERHVESLWRQVRKHGPAIYHSVVFKQPREPQ